MIKFLFPWVNSKKANNKIKARISLIAEGNIAGNLDYMNGFENLDISDVQIFYDKTLDVKQSLEDKLKTSLFSVTIGITVLTSAITLLFSDGVSSLDHIYKGVIFLSGSLAVLYMILAGIFSIKTISDFIAVYQIFPEDIANSDEVARKESIAICAELNSLSNIIRQNIVNISYHCIINSLFVITIFFFLIGFSSFADKKTSAPIELNFSVQPLQSEIDLINARINDEKIVSSDNYSNLEENINRQKDGFITVAERLNKIEKSIKENTDELIYLKSMEIKNSNKSN